MVFSSLIFLYGFLPLCYLAYLAAGSLKQKNLILMLFSLFFYAWGEPLWVVLMIATGLFIWWAGLRIERHRGKPLARVYLILTIIAALSSLAAFKYTGFVVENLNLLLGLFGASLPVPQIRLPIGISFYTFQTLTYAIDLYRGQTRVQRSPVNFLLYEALFPQLIAGPIVRYADVAEQIDDRRVTYSGFARGITRFLIGLGKKVLIANHAAEIVRQTIGSTGGLSSLGVADAWGGIIAFSLQIYFDFSGYSDMAIGLGHMFGFTFKENFNYPYMADSITDFWRRWHISLSTFFRDYVYIPLGGNRSHHIRNMLIIWGLTGLWHGASWNFILWGLYFFVFLVLEKKVFARPLQILPSLFRRLYALFVVLIGWVLFYFTSLADIGRMLSILFGFSGQPLTTPTGLLLLRSNLLFIVLACFAATPVMARLGRGLVELQRRTTLRPAMTGLIIAANVLLLFTCTAALVGSTYNPFLYFRF